VARRVVRDALELVGGAASFGDVQRVLALSAATGGGDRLDLHRVAARQAGLRLWIGAPSDGQGARPFDLPLALPGQVRLPETGSVLTASFVRGAPPPSFEDPNRAVLQAWSLRAPFVVRSRRPGDRFRPFGAPGSRKLQDVFVDRKIPRADRDRVPVVVDASGRIVWVAGVTIAHDCRVTMPEAGVVILEMKKGQQ
jgi:tRNA(Ile)-lysidine synthase